MRSGEPPLIDTAPLEAYLDAHALGSGEIEAERIGEGHSNITYLVRRGDTRLVLSLIHISEPTRPY